MTTQRYNIGAVKIAEAERDVAQSIPLRGYLDIIGSNVPDDDDQFPIGANTTYSRDLTEEEVEQFRAASNCRYVEADEIAYPAYGVDIPDQTTRNYSGYPNEYQRWHGRDVTIGICDTGTTQALRDSMGFTLVARNLFSTDPTPDEVWTGQYHGCYVASTGIPYGGRLVDAMMTNSAGSTTTAFACAAFVWCADQGAQLINYSFASNPSQAMVDAMDYLSARGVHLWAAAGNDGLADYMRAPAVYCTTYSNVHSVGSFNENTNLMSTTPPTNYDTDLTGVSSGTLIAARSATGGTVSFSGTSAASPNALQMHARMMTGGKFTANQTAIALRTSGRKTGRPANEEGNNGAFDLGRALAQLNALAPDIQVVTGRNDCPNPSARIDSAGWGTIGAVSSSGRVTSGVGVDRPTGFSLTKSSPVENAVITFPTTTPRNVPKYGSKPYSISYQYYCNVSATHQMRVNQFDSAGTWFWISDLLPVAQGPGVFRSSMELTFQASTAAVTVHHIIVNCPIGATVQVFAARFAPGTLEFQPYGDGLSFGWQWQPNGDSGPKTYGRGII